MVSNPHAGPSRPTAYGSAKDLPSYQELSQLVRGGKLVTRFFARDHHRELLEIEKEMDRLARVVDDFYDRLGQRNWIFHDILSVDKVGQLLTETPDAESAEQRLIEIYRDPETTQWWTMRLGASDGLRQRIRQIERARAHYDAGQFDSCTMHLIAVMDGFVSDFEPGHRKGLYAREPDEMTAWDSVVGHHMGLTHVMATFLKTIKRRVDHEVFEVYRHGIMHGSVVNFDNVIVATKAWNMLFAVADWAAATRKAAEPKEPAPTFKDTVAALARRGRYKRYEQAFKSSTLTATDPDFATNNVVMLAAEFLDAWQHRQWGLVAKFIPPALRSPGRGGQVAYDTRDIFEQHPLEDWSIDSVTYDQASTVAIQARCTLDGLETEVRFRMVYWTSDGHIGIPEQDDGAWSLAVWAPHTFFQKAI